MVIHPLDRVLERQKQVVLCESETKTDLRRDLRREREQGNNSVIVLLSFMDSHHRTCLSYFSVVKSPYKRTYLFQGLLIILEDAHGHQGRSMVATEARGWSTS